MRIIGLAGKARAGKDTAAGFIADWGERQGFEVERRGFADKLKVSAALSLGFEPEAADGDAVAQCVAFCNRVKQNGVTVRVELFHSGSTGPDPAAPEYEPLMEISGREFLQRYGTEGHRDVFGSEFWVEALLDEALPHGPDDPRWGTTLVIPDVRFENEARAIHNAGGEVWEIIRDDNPDELKSDPNAHVSEAGVPDDLIDFTLHNAGSLEDLEREVGLAILERGVR